MKFFVVLAFLTVFTSDVHCGGDSNACGSAIMTFNKLSADVKTGYQIFFPQPSIGETENQLVQGFGELTAFIITELGQTLSPEDQILMERINNEGAPTIMCIISYIRG